MNLSVIIITAERMEPLRRCVESLRDELRPEDEIIVVSASGEFREIELEGEFPNLRAIRSERMNMPYQRNVGLHASDKNIVAYIDDDAEAMPGWRDALMEPYADPDVASVVGKVTHPDETAPRSGALPGVQWYGSIRSLYHFDSQDPCDVAVGQGGNMSFRRDGLNSLGGFDDRYLQRANYEESDLFERLGRGKHRVVYHPRMAVRHEPADPVGYARSEFDRHSAFHVHRNRAYFYAKHYLGRLPFWCHLVFDSVRLIWICLKRIAHITVHTLVVFVLACTGKLFGTVEGIRFRIRGRKL